MKKTIFTLALLFSAIMVFAQESSCAVGLQLGFSQNIYRCNTPDNDVLSKTNLNGSKIGFVFEGNIIKGFGAYIALNYTYGGGSTKWAKESKQESLYPQYRSRYDLHSLELACDWQYKFAIAQNTYIILYTGPSIQCNLSLHETEWEKGQFDEGHINKTIRIIGDYDEKQLYKTYKRINACWGVGAGFQYDRYFIRGGYDFGLVNPYVIKNFDEVEKANYNSLLTRGRQDQWFVKLGIYLWESDN